MRVWGPPGMPDIPVVVLGAGGVGKSCLTIQFIQGHFVDGYDATIEDVYRMPVEIDGVPAVLTVVDTAGQDAFGSMRDQYMRKGQGFVLVYSITDTESFVQMEAIYAQLLRVRGSMRSPPCVLVANKVDQEAAYRAVERERGRRFASEVMRCPFREVTAKDHRMAEEVFELLVRTIRSSGGTSPCSAGPSSTSQLAHHGVSSTAAAGTGERDGGTRRDVESTSADTPTAVKGGSSTNRKRRQQQKKCVLL